MCVDLWIVCNAKWFLSQNDNQVIESRPFISAQMPISSLFPHTRISHTAHMNYRQAFMYDKWDIKLLNTHRIEKCSPENMK